MRDPFRSRLARRVVTFPTLLIAWLLGTALLPVMLPLCAIADLARGGPAVLARSALFFTFYLWCEVLGLLAALCIWLTVGWHGARSLDANRTLQRAWNLALLRGGGAIFSMQVSVEGLEELVKPGALLVFPRHVSTVDTMFPVVLLRPYGCRFVLKRSLLVDPCLDVVGNRLPNCFAARGSGNTAAEVARVTSLLADLSAREAVVIYPEGTRFSVSRRARLLEKTTGGAHPKTAEAAALLHHTLPPLTSGTLALLRENPGADVLFIAHAGLERAGGFPDFIRGGLVGARVTVKMWRVPFAEIPTDDDGRAAFMVDQWKRVDDFVGGPSGGPAVVLSA